MTEPTTNTGNTLKKSEAALDSALNVFEFLIQDMGERVSSSKALRKVGTNDDFASKIEAVINHPLDSFSEVSDRISSQLKTIVRFKIESELIEFKDSIDGFWLLKKSGDHLNYIISLKESNFELRDRILDVALNYQLKTISNRHRVTFQFTDSESSFFESSVIKLDESVSE